jgi:hypothetical protein
MGFKTGIGAAVVLMAGVALVAPAHAMPGRQTDLAWCAAHPDTKDPQWRQSCVTRAWCAAHWNEDWITRISCDPMRSRADRKLPRIILSPGGLAASRDLNEVETHLDCTPPFHSRSASLCAWGSLRLPVDEKDDRLLPPGMTKAKLGLYARIAVWTFPITVVRLGIASADTGTITLSWNRNGNGPRATESAKLDAREIARLIAALNASDFWRSPHEPMHMGATDGEVATVAVGIAGRQNQVNDVIGDSEAVDLSILVNALSTIIRNHWQNVPA